MKIAVNTRLLLPGKLEGIGWFTYESLKRITRNHPEHQFYFIFDRPFSDEFIFSDNVTPVVASPPARHPVLWYIYFEYGVPSVLKKIKPDLFLSPDGWIPLHSGIKTVNVIHDLNFEHHPEFIKPSVMAYYKHFFRRFAQSSQRIATVSEFTKTDIHQLYRVSPEIIDVVYNGANDLFKPCSEERKKEIRSQYAENNPYFLFVGLIHKRKNLDNIFRAFDHFKTTDNTGTKLVVVGEKKWWKGDIEESFRNMKYQNDVIFLGRKPVEELALLMAAATGLVYPSLFEGFGIPILEAFKAETAVITSTITSMPEIAGEAALLVDPYQPEEISRAMSSLINHPELRKDLINKGVNQGKKYSWDRTAEALWKTIEQVLFNR